jgi:hypothetical protein
MKRRTATSWLILLLIITISAFIGNIIGEIIRPYAPFAGSYAPLALEPVRYSMLDILTLTFGFSFRFNLTGALFALIGLLVAYRRR